MDVKKVNNDTYLLVQERNKEKFDENDLINDENKSLLKSWSIRKYFICSYWY